MTTVDSDSDLSIGDIVLVRDHENRGKPGRQGTVVSVGKVAAVIMFASGQEAIRYKRRVTRFRGSMLRAKYRADFFPIDKLSAHDIWLTECPKNDRVWGSKEPTLIVRTSAVLDEFDYVIDDLRRYSEWLQREPKEEP